MTTMTMPMALHCRMMAQAPPQHTAVAVLMALGRWSVLAGTCACVRRGTRLKTARAGDTSIGATARWLSVVTRCRLWAMQRWWAMDMVVQRQLEEAGIMVVGGGTRVTRGCSVMMKGAWWWCCCFACCSACVAARVLGCLLHPPASFLLRLCAFLWTTPCHALGLAVGNHVSHTHTHSSLSPTLSLYLPQVRSHAPAHERCIQFLSSTT